MDESMEVNALFLNSHLSFFCPLHNQTFQRGNQWNAMLKLLMILPMSQLVSDHFLQSIDMLLLVYIEVLALKSPPLTFHRRH